jgi:hypothetical protein
MSFARHSATVAD